MTMQYGSRLVSPHGSSKPSSMALSGIKHLCSTTLTAPRATDNFLSFGTGACASRTSRLFPLHAAPVRADQVPARAHRKTPYRTEGVHQ
jgi:hypothetical protein